VPRFCRWLKTVKWEEAACRVLMIIDCAGRSQAAYGAAGASMKQRRTLRILSQYQPGNAVVVRRRYEISTLTCGEYPVMNAVGVFAERAGHFRPFGCRSYATPSERRAGAGRALVVYRPATSLNPARTCRFVTDPVALGRCVGPVTPSRWCLDAKLMRDWRDDGKGRRKARSRPYARIASSGPG